MSTKLTQYQASRATGGKLKKDHVSGLKAGTPCSLAWRRSYLDRPRYLGGRLTHEFDASCALPDAAVAKLVLTDRELVEIAVRPAVDMSRNSPSRP